MAGSKRIHTNKLYAAFIRDRKTQRKRKRIKDEEVVRNEIREYIKTLPQK